MEEQLMHWCVAGVSSVCIFPGRFPERNRSYTEVATFMATYSIGDPKAWVTSKELDQMLEGKLVFGVVDKFTSKVRWCDIR